MYQYSIISKEQSHIVVDLTEMIVPRRDVTVQTANGDGQYRLYYKITDPTTIPTSWIQNRFDSINNNRFLDQSGVLDFTISGNVTNVVVDDKTVVRFGGSSGDILTAGVFAPINALTQFTFAISLYVRSVSYNFAGIFGNNAGGPGMMLYFPGVTNQLSLYINSKATAVPFTLNAQHYIVGQQNGSQAQLWVDGTGSTPLSVSGSISTGTSFVMGQLPYAEYMTNMDVNDFYMWNHALDELDLEQLITNFK